MAFVFDADPTSATMNSYVDLGFADDYFAAKFGSAKWTDQTEANKQALLASATRILERFEFGGLKTLRTQPLKWPRQALYDNEGNPHPTLSVPVLLQQATCEQAWWILTEEDRVLDNTTLSQFSTFSAGPLNLTMKKGAPEDLSTDAIGLINAMGTGTLVSTGDNGQGVKSMSMRL